MVRRIFRAIILAAGLCLAGAAPAGTPEPVIARLHTEINRVPALSEVRERFGALGESEPWITTPEEFAAAIRRDYDKYGKLVKDIGAKID